VNEETRDFVHGVEDERVSPGDDCASQWALSLALTSQGKRTYRE
jgi:hypothetical protein